MRRGNNAQVSSRQGRSPVSSVGQIHIVKDEGHSTWNVHLSQHNHVSAMERNTESDVIKQRDIMPSHICLKFSYLDNSTILEERQFDLSNSFSVNVRLI